MRRWRKGILLMCAALVPLMVCARIFRTVNVDDGQLNVAGLPWETAYQTTMKINGERRALKVYSSRDEVSMVTQLAQQFEAQGASVTITPVNGMMLGVARGGGYDARFAVVTSPSLPNQLAFVFYPEKGSGKGAVEVPAYPQALSKKSVENEQTKTSTHSFKTRDAAEQVQSYYAALLHAGGWKVLVPARLSSPQAGSMALYQKRSKVCCVSVKPSAGGMNAVTVLVKGGSL